MSTKVSSFERLTLYDKEAPQTGVLMHDWISLWASFLLHMMLFFKAIFNHTDTIVVIIMFSYSMIAMRYVKTTHSIKLIKMANLACLPEKQHEIRKNFNHKAVEYIGFVQKVTLCTRMLKIRMLKTHIYLFPLFQTQPLQTLYERRKDWVLKSWKENRQTSLKVKSNPTPRMLWRKDRKSYCLNENKPISRT